MWCVWGDTACIDISLLFFQQDMGCGSSTPHAKDPPASRNGQVCGWFEDNIGFMNDELKDFINNEVGADTEAEFATTLLDTDCTDLLIKAKGFLPRAKQKKLVLLLEETVAASSAPGKPQWILILLLPFCAVRVRCCEGALL